VNEQCKGKAEDLMKKEVIFNCVALFCMFLYTSLYSAVTAHISIFQPFVYVPGCLFEDGVTTVYTYVGLHCCTGPDTSSVFVFIFLMK
jgi:hypothetical protein